MRSTFGHTRTHARVQTRYVPDEKKEKKWNVCFETSEGKRNRKKKQKTKAYCGVVLDADGEERERYPAYQIFEKK